MAMKYVLNRMKEPSTYSGIAFLILLLGGKVDQEKFDAIATTGAAIAGAVSILLPEKKD